MSSGEVREGLKAAAGECGATVGLFHQIGETALQAVGPAAKAVAALKGAVTLLQGLVQSTEGIEGLVNTSVMKLGDARATVMNVAGTSEKSEVKGAIATLDHAYTETQELLTLWTTPLKVHRTAAALLDHIADLTNEANYLASTQLVTNQLAENTQLAQQRLEEAAPQY